MTRHIENSRANRKRSGELVKRVSRSSGGRGNAEKVSARKLFESFLNPGASKSLAKQKRQAARDGFDIAKINNSALSHAPDHDNQRLSLSESDLMMLGAFWRAPSVKRVIDGAQLRSLIGEIGVSNLKSILRFEGPSEPTLEPLENVSTESLLHEGRRCRDAYLRRDSDAALSGQTADRATLVETLYPKFESLK